MTPEERASLKMESVKGTVSQNLLEGPIAKNLALEHLFERASVFLVDLTALRTFKCIPL
jgi:hypothetical protein